jgi:hypothetical protein
VDAAIMLEDKNKASRESRQRRMMSQGGPSSQRSRSLPPSRPAPPPQRFASQAPGQTIPTGNPTTTILEAGTTQVVTATLPTPKLMAKEVADIPVVSLDTSPRSIP